MPFNQSKHRLHPDYAIKLNVYTMQLRPKSPEAFEFFPVHVEIGYYTVVVKSNIICELKYHLVIYRRDILHRIVFVVENTSCSNGMRHTTK